MKKVKLCMLACIWSLLMTGCSAFWTGQQGVHEDPYATEEAEWSKEAESGEAIETPEAAAQPEMTVEPEAIVGTEATVEPEVTVEPETTVEPEVTAEPEITTDPQEDYSYFEDALFIGDSRTVGLREYGLFENSDFFATPGLSIYAVPRTKVTVQDLEEVTLEELLAAKDYGKIYLMLGMNELGYDFEQTVERYRTFVEDLQAKEPEAQLYLCANMHVNIVRTENDDIFNNPNINKINEEIRKLAEEKELVFLDVNPLFDDENGNLSDEYTSDDSHVLGIYYEDWCRWLAENISE